MLVGYARVSTGAQDLAAQMGLLKEAGCEKIFTDVVSGVAEERIGLKEAFDFVREEDVLVVWRLDRLGRSLTNLIKTINILNLRGVGFKSLQENIDTVSPGGKLVFHIFGAIAEFERDLIRSRTSIGLEAARARGRKGGRPLKLNGKKVELARKLLADKTNSVAEVCQMLNVSKATLYRTIRTDKLRPENPPSR